MNTITRAFRIWLLVTTGLLCSASYAAESFDDSVISHIAYPDWFVDIPFNDLQRVLNEAQESEKLGLMVLFTTEGCSYCDVFIRKGLGNPEIAEILQTDFVSVGMEIFNDAEMIAPTGEIARVNDFAKANGVQFSPAILFYRIDGKPLLRLVGYQSPDRFKRVLDFLTEGAYREMSLKNYLLTRPDKKPQIDAVLPVDSLFLKPPFDLRREGASAARPLMVVFNKAGCEECLAFKLEVLKDDEVRKILSSFDVVQLNTDSTEKIIGPDGGEMTARQWFDNYELSRYPALVFVNGSGDVVLQTDSLMLKQRMKNALHYVLEEAYEKGWTYQRFARQKGMERYQRQLSQ